MQFLRINFHQITENFSRETYSADMMDGNVIIYIYLSLKLSP